MPRKKKFLAFIPARGNSKGLPRKNLLDLAGKPLVAWTIEAALNSAYISQTVVSSESEEILSIAALFGARTIKRPEELSADTAPPEAAAHHAISHLEKLGEKYDYLVLLQPTSPLRDHRDIDQAIEKLLEKRATALISVYEPDHTPYKTFKLSPDGFLIGTIDNKSPFARRQDLPRVFMPNGAIYIIRMSHFLKNQSLLTPKTIHHLMPSEKSIDIDTKADLKRLGQIIKRFSATPKSNAK